MRACTRRNCSPAAPACFAHHVSWADSRAAAYSSQPSGFVSPSGFGPRANGLCAPPASRRAPWGPPWRGAPGRAAVGPRRPRRIPFLPLLPRAVDGGPWSHIWNHHAARERLYSTPTVPPTRAHSGRAPQYVDGDDASRDPLMPPLRCLLGPRAGVTEAQILTRARLAGGGRKARVCTAHTAAGRHTRCHLTRTATTRAWIQVAAIYQHIIRWLRSIRLSDTQRTLSKQPSLSDLCHWHGSPAASMNGLERGASTSSMGSYADTYCRLIGESAPQGALPEVEEPGAPLRRFASERDAGTDEGGGAAPDTSCDFAIAKALAESGARPSRGRVRAGLVR